MYSAIQILENFIPVSPKNIESVGDQSGNMLRCLNKFCLNHKFYNPNPPFFITQGNKNPSPQDIKVFDFFGTLIS